MNRSRLAVYCIIFCILAILMFFVSFVKESPSPQNIYESDDFSVSLTFYYAFPNKPDEIIEMASASGFLVEIDNEPFVATAGHVILEPAAIIHHLVVFFKNGPSPQSLQVVGYNRLEDVSLLKFEKKDIYPEILKHCAKLGDSSSLAVGQRVVAAGTDLDIFYSLSVGYIKDLSFGIGVYNFLSQMTSINICSQPQLILHDAALNPGMSGGALINECGEVVGMNQFIKISAKTVNPCSAAIPINDVMAILKKIKNGETFPLPKPPFLLGNTALLDDGAIDALKIQRPDLDGPVILHLDPEFSASGLRPGDVIRFFAGKKINTVNDIMRQIFIYSKIGDKIEMTVERDGQNMDLEIELAPLGIGVPPTTTN